MMPRCSVARPRWLQCSRQAWETPSRLSVPRQPVRHSVEPPAHRREESVPEAGRESRSAQSPACCGAFREPGSESRTAARPVSHWTDTVSRRPDLQLCPYCGIGFRLHHLGDDVGIWRDQGSKRMGSAAILPRFSSMVATSSLLSPACRPMVASASPMPLKSSMIAFGRCAVAGAR